MRNAALYAAGLVMGAANAVRHRHQGYVSPRPFSAAEVERTIEHAVGIVDRLQEHGGIDWAGLRVLEIGPGNDLSTGAVMLARGAASYRAVDLFDNTGQADPALYARLGARLGTPVRTDALGFTLATFPHLPEIDGPFDLIVSNATLEHVADVPALFVALRRVAAPEARMVHHVDGQTHMRWIKDVDPLNILRYSDRVYARLLDFPGAPNRLRWDDYAAAAAAAGWQDLDVVADVEAPRGYLEQTQVAPRFRAADGLALLTFTMTARAPSLAAPRRADAGVGSG